jgi:HD superfamily phosphohydrolase YqeK
MDRKKIDSMPFPGYFKKWYLFLQSMLSPVRFKHCVDVGVAMGKAYAIYGSNGACPPLNREDWMLAGLLHDAVKETSVQTMRWWIEKYSPGDLLHIPPSMQDHHIYLHGPAAAVYAQHALGVRRAGAFYEGIIQHVGNYENMSFFARCLHVADMTAPTERYPGCDKLHRVYFSGDLNSAELLLDTWTVEYFVRVGFPIHPAFAPKIARLTDFLKPSPGFLSREDP